MLNRRILFLAVAAFWAPSSGRTINGLESAFFQNVQAKAFLVNDDTLGGCAQTFPAVAADGSGGFVMAWADQRNGHYGNWGDGYFYRGNDVYFQRFDEGGSPLGPNRKVNEGAGNLARNSKHSVSIAANRSGRFVIAWEDVRGNPDLNQDIFFQIFNAQGNALGPNQRANEADAGFSQYAPAVSMDQNGGFVIVWGQYGPDYQDPGILFRRFDAEGNPLGGNQNAPAGGGTLWIWTDGPCIAVDGSGRFAIAWVGRIDEGSTPDICFQRFDASANPIGPNRTANDTTVWAEPASPSIGMNGHGDFVIAWLDSRNHSGEDVDYYDVYFQQYDSSGQAAGGNRTALGDTGSEGQYHPTVAIGDDGRLAIAWNDNRIDRSQSDAYFQRYDGEGHALGGSVKAGAAGENSSQTASQLVIDSAGGFIVVWEDDLNGKVNTDVFCQRFDAEGNAREACRRANDDSGSADQTRPAVAMAGNSGFIVAWTDERNSFQDPFLTYDIFFRQYDAKGNPMGPSRQVNEEISKIRDSTNPAVASDADGNFVIAWTDNRIHSWDIYCQRFDASGQALGSNEMVNTGGNYDSEERSPAIAMNSRGDYVIAWMSSQAWDSGICFQRFDSDGHRIGANRESGYGSGGDLPSVVMDESGRIALAWYVNAYYDINGAVTLLSEVFVERFDAEGKSLGRSQRANDVANGPRGAPSLAMNRAGEFVAAWQDRRNGKNEVYHQLYDSNGNPLGTNQKSERRRRNRRAVSARGDPR